jgi:hypothetical protein
MAINREGGGGHRGERMALELKKFVRRIWGSSSDLKRRLTQAQPVVGRGLVRVWHRVYIWRYKLRLFVVRHGAFARCIALIVAIGASILAISVLEHLLETHFTSEAGLSMLRTLLVTLGGALIGAILILFLSGYRRALDLINPVVQLRLIMTSAQKDMRRWARMRVAWRRC